MYAMKNSKESVNSILLQWIMQRDLYQILAIVSPFSIAYLISPEKFPENKYYSLFLLIFYTAIFIFIYNIYFKSKMKNDEKIRIKIAPSAIKSRVKLKSLSEELIAFNKDCILMKDEKTIFKILIHYFIIISNNFIIKIDYFLNTIDHIEHNLKEINTHGKELHEKMNYKHFDYTLMFTGSLILILKISDLDIISTSVIFNFLNSEGFIILYLFIMFIYIVFVYIDYLALRIVTIFFLTALPLTISVFRHQRKKLYTRH